MSIRGCGVKFLSLYCFVFQWDSPQEEGAVGKVRDTSIEPWGTPHRGEG